VDPGSLSELGENVTKSKNPIALYKGKGCKNCKQSGYYGRKGMFELFLINDRIKQLITEKAPARLIRETAVNQLGMTSLREDGLRKVLSGMTTLEEVERVAYKAAFEA
jgi:type II secretory ATPase GspE/PulE/Tfp pilus assembly ATPase PilB-like protein